MAGCLVRWYRRRMDPQDNSDQEQRPRTVDEVVAWNLARLRRAAGLTQQLLGDMIGWNHLQVSAAERSTDGSRTRRFDATTLAAIAKALDVPLVALFIPPDDGRPIVIGDTEGTAADLMRLVMPDTPDEAPAADAYRAWWNEAVALAFADDPDWARLVARWAGSSDGGRAERAARLRADRDILIRMAVEFDELADGFDPPKE
jgi:transcriptional regulator with XRE-family HTH domain